MDSPPKVSFALEPGTKRKRKTSGLVLASNEARNEVPSLKFSASESLHHHDESLREPAASDPKSPVHSPNSFEAQLSNKSTLPERKEKRVRFQLSGELMAEPPAKRTKRTDSSAMWDRNSTRAAEAEQKSKPNDDERDKRDRRDDRSRHHGKDDRRHRSRSRDIDKRRERSRSRDREKGRNKDSTRRRSRSRDRHRTGDDRDRRERKRSSSRDRHRSRRDDSPPRRADRRRSRSRSPQRSKHPTRTRSPPRPSPSNPTTKPPSSNSTTKATPQSTTAPSSTPTPIAPHPPPTSPPPDSTSTPMAMDIDSDPETALLRQMMGFAGFKSTKNTKVPGNDVYAVRKEKKTEYRQYMNRVGGFNRPLSPSR